MTKKGKSIREQRLLEEERKRKKYQEQEALRQEAERKRREEEKSREEAARRKEMEENLHPVTERSLSSENKSRSKAAGLKSTFILSEHELLMTSFGRGSEAIPEKYIVGTEITTLPEKAAFTVHNDCEAFFEIDGRVQRAVADNPLHKYEKDDHGQDRISREKLEMRYYGRTFEDNIHIQVIYNILDIEKIMSIHINNIIFTINNLLRREEEDFSDLIGYITLCEKYEDLSKKGREEIRDSFDRLCNAPQLAYYNFQIEKKGKKDPNAIILTEKEFFSIIYTLGYLRQMLMHGAPKQNIYRTDALKDKAFKHCLDTINRIYNDRVAKLNGNFLNLATKNLSMLFSAFDVHGADEKAEYVRDYYEFVVRKQFKNQGFSIKYLRECISDHIEDAAVLRDQKYDSVRGKLYPFINFAIFRYYNVYHKEADYLVDSLRASMNEVEKDAVYRREAVRIWPRLKKLILNHILPEMTGSKIKEKDAKPDPEMDASMIDSVKIGTESTLFTKIIFLTTLFLNGKETNDLITTLISKFEDINAFCELLKEQNMPGSFVNDFAFFSDCGKVSEELRIVNSFAHMKKESMSAKKIMFDEALIVLGIDDAEKERELDQMLDKDARKQNPQRAGLRNFIANNVIESDRFKYLVRYGNVKRIKGIASNQAVIGFVLGEIADTQIVRYYKSIYGDENCSVQKMRGRLTLKLTGFSFFDIADVEQNDRYTNVEAQEEKRQKQALVRLYLTALYLILKNLVYINSRYSLAFMILERDYWLEKDKKDEKVLYTEPVRFAQELIQKRPYKKRRVQIYMDQNFANSDAWAIHVYRNKIQHLDAVRHADMYIGDIREFHSWFELYHYIIQRRIIDQYAYESTPGSSRDGSAIIDEERLNPATRRYFRLITTYKTCCKDFIKALNAPFAYNLARFKNLTIDGLFDKNRKGETAIDENGEGTGDSI